MDIEKKSRPKVPKVQVGDHWYPKYDPGIALKIVERIADGELLRDITSKDAEELTVTRATFLHWVATVPELSKAYAAARQISALALEEEALHRAHEIARAPGTPQRVTAYNTLISQLRWSAARRNPTQYSDKGDTKIVVPITINSSLDLGTGNQKGDVEIPDMYSISIPQSAGQDEPDAIDGEFEEVKDEAAPTKDALKEMIDTTPIERTERQPVLEAARRPKFIPNNTGRKRKRVLTPRVPKQ